MRLRSDISLTESERWVILNALAMYSSYHLKTGDTRTGEKAKDLGVRVEAADEIKLRRYREDRPSVEEGAKQ